MHHFMFLPIAPVSRRFVTSDKFNERSVPDGHWQKREYCTFRNWSNSLAPLRSLRVAA